MLISRRTILRLLAGIGVYPNLAVLNALAQGYPVRPIQLFVGFAPGGAVDITARQVGRKLSESLGQTVVIQNRPGASAMIATEAVARSVPDGYTLLLIPISTAVYSGLRTDLPYNLERDFSPVSLVATGPFLLVVNSEVPANNVKELIELAQSQPGKLNCASVGVGSAHHLVQELFKMRAKVDIVHVPFKGDAPAGIAVVSGDVQMSFNSLAGALPFLKSGKIRALAVTSAKRLSSLPSVPTLSEAGLPGFDYSAWYGVSAPAGVPKDIIMRLNAAIGEIVRAPELKEFLLTLGFEAQSSTPEEFAAIIHREIERTKEVAQLIKLKVE